MELHRVTVARSFFKAVRQLTGTEDRPQSKAEQALAQTEAEVLAPFRAEPQPVLVQPATLLSAEVLRSADLPAPAQFPEARAAHPAPRDLLSS